jgi:putative tryptophan/tyrosine transport system substrate-binding protein
MDRRRFFGVFASGLAVARSFAAQPGKVYRIGYLGGTPPTAEPRLWEGFFEGLRDLGYVDGQNFHFEGRYYGDRIERLPALAAELVQLKVDVIVAGGPPAPEAAQRATTTIPIIVAYHPDPVGSGLAASLARPGGNVTGMSVLTPELVGKQLQLLKEVIPGMSRVAVLSNPTVPTNALLLKEAEVAAPVMNVQLQVLEVQAPGDFDSAFSAMMKDRSGALIVLGSSMFFAERARIVALAAQSRLPSMYLLKQYVEAGGLMAYGASNRESFRRAATYVDKVLKGAKPGDLPIEQPAKFELVINLKAAKALGLTIPQSLLLRADEVIQ